MPEKNWADRWEDKGGLGTCADEVRRKRDERQEDYVRRHGSSPIVNLASGLFVFLIVIAAGIGFLVFLTWAARQ